jgi:hypothetical protein
MPRVKAARDELAAELRGTYPRVTELVAKKAAYPSTLPYRRFQKAIPKDSTGVAMMLHGRDELAAELAKAARMSTCRARWTA